MKKNRDDIVIVRARTHNLKGINLNIPKNSFVVICGLSGSGKSSLAFDTLYAEGQRRYVESLSSYARQFLEQLQKPDVESISNLSPAIAIEEKGGSANPRSTVATSTEIHDFMRVLFARAGIPHCPKCGRVIKGFSPDEIISDILSSHEGKEIELRSNVVSGRKGSFTDLFLKLRKEGFASLMVDGRAAELEGDIVLDKKKKHDISVIIDRFRAGKERLTDSLNAALALSGGVCELVAGKTVKTYSVHHACTRCGLSVKDLSPRAFSFNSPYGACPECTGLGEVMTVDEALAVNADLSIEEGALIPWFSPITTRTHRWVRAAAGYYQAKLDEACSIMKIPMDVKWKKLSKQQREFLLHGSLPLLKSASPYKGLAASLKERFSSTESDFVREEISRLYMRKQLCPVCLGKRLKDEILAVQIGGKSIADVCDMPVSEVIKFFSALSFSGSAAKIAAPLLKEINSRLSFISGVGLGYLTLSRSTRTLSRGEAQRIRLATQIGSGLSGVLYVLDEPTIGLHQKDIHALMLNLMKLKETGNSVIVVEHEEAVMLAADWIIELGPGAGALGGEVVFEGTPSGMLKSAKSLTGKYIRNSLTVKKTKKQNRGFIRIKGAKQFNLKNIDADIPLGVLTCVTGVSGSGKSTLIEDILMRSLRKKLTGSREEPGSHSAIEGFEKIDKALVIDQSPIGRTPRSNPVTYTKAWDEIRALFAAMPLAKSRGYKAGQFSFNVKSGRCAACGGDGLIKVEMNFLPDVYVKCDVCEGRRYSAETLEVTFKGQSIHDVLEMSVNQAIDFFAAHKKIMSKLKMLQNVGLGYLKLGQSAVTLSGGEAQRVKLSRELAKSATGRTLYFLDEPTTGLHFADIEKLLAVLVGLTEKGNTVVVIEHNMDVIKTADWIIDLGPGGGESGGRLLFQGAPEDILSCKGSFTGQYLKEKGRAGK
ncbi:MAG: excinuclease ABC subunit UvrA [Elusimicrobia bacterium CG03_land_8_20_14_0_80_50_18]|nr:MAG: excinuclease ABC subunit UvrA [Elusimicrobia bacterium CG03_land_8_20_14_0_80_50_18]